MSAQLTKTLWFSFIKLNVKQSSLCILMWARFHQFVPRQTVSFPSLEIWIDHLATYCFVCRTAKGHKIHVGIVHVFASSFSILCVFRFVFHFATGIQTSIPHLHNLFETLNSYILIKCLSELCVEWFTIDNLTITF